MYVDYHPGSNVFKPRENTLYWGKESSELELKDVGEEVIQRT